MTTNIQTKSNAMPLIFNFSKAVNANEFKQECAATSMEYDDRLQISPYSVMAMHPTKGAPIYKGLTKVGATSVMDWAYPTHPDF